VIPADQIVKAVGQMKLPVATLLALATSNGFIRVDEAFQTSADDVFAIGDITRIAGAASTVMAVQDGKLAAIAIHNKLAERRPMTGSTQPLAAQTEVN